MLKKLATIFTKEFLLILSLVGDQKKKFVFLGCSVTQVKAGWYTKSDRRDKKMGQKDPFLEVANQNRGGWVVADQNHPIDHG